MRMPPRVQALSVSCDYCRLVSMASSWACIVKTFCAAFSSKSAGTFCVL